MDQNKKMLLMFRIKDHEIVNLQNTLAFLSDRQQSLKIDEKTQKNYQRFIDSAPKIVQERDSLLKELADIAKFKYESSSHTDMTANMCIYLINKQKKAEELIVQLQNQYIESKYGKRFLLAELAENDPFPEKLEKMKPKYKSLKHDLDKFTENIEENQAVLQSIKKELDDIRKNNRESERSVPETARNMFYSVNEYDKQFHEISQKAQKKQTEYDDKKFRYEKRINLINDIIGTLKDEVIDQADKPSKTIVNELKLIFENINGENRSSKFVKSRINILLKSIISPNNQKESNSNSHQQQLKDCYSTFYQNQLANQKQLKTPQAIKNYQSIITPQQTRNYQRQYYTPDEIQQRLNTPSQSIKDLKEKFRLLEKRKPTLPSYVTPPNAKSSK